MAQPSSFGSRQYPISSALEWEDLDHGKVEIYRTIDRRYDNGQETKVDTTVIGDDPHRNREG